MARWFAPTPTISINDFRNGQGTGYNNINTIRFDAYPGREPVSNWRDLGTYRNQFHYRFSINMNVFSGQGYIAVTYPYNSGNTSFHQTYWVAQGPYSYVTITAGDIYPRTFSYWSIPGYGIWSYTRTINIYYYDQVPVNYDTITANFF